MSFVKEMMGAMSIVDMALCEDSPEAKLELKMWSSLEKMLEEGKLDAIVAYWGLFYFPDVFRAYVLGADIEVYDPKEGWLLTGRPLFLHDVKYRIKQ